MSENKSVVEKATKKSSGWFKGLKAEFNKVVWESRENVQKQTIAVLVVSIILGVIIALVDMVLQYGVDFIIGL